MPDWQKEGMMIEVTWVFYAVFIYLVLVAVVVNVLALFGKIII